MSFLQGLIDRNRPQAPALQARQQVQQPALPADEGLVQRMMEEDQYKIVPQFQGQNPSQGKYPTGFSRMHTNTDRGLY